jgi:hypothetical protein
MISVMEDDCDRLLFLFVMKAFYPGMKAGRLLL